MSCPRYIGAQGRSPHHSFSLALRLRSLAAGPPGGSHRSPACTCGWVCREPSAHDALISHDILTLGSESPAHIGRRRNRQHGGLGVALGSCASTAGASAFGTWARDGLWEQGGAGCTMARRPFRTLRTVAAPERAPGWLACSARNRMRAEKSPESYFAFITKRVPTIVRRWRDSGSPAKSPGYVWSRPRTGLLSAGAERCGR
jgi:hypothetical protein